MTDRTVCVVITARPSYSRVRSVLRAIESHPSLSLQVVLAASALAERYGDMRRIVRGDGFRIDAEAHTLVEGSNGPAMARTIGLGVIEVSTILSILQPHVVVTVGDRYETLATAAATSALGLPLAHVQGGEITGSIDERVRHAVTKLADLHFPATQVAGRRIEHMGENPDMIHVVGCPSLDLVRDALLPQDNPSFGAEIPIPGVGAAVDITGPFITVIMHPVTTEIAAARAQAEAVLQAVETIQMPTLWFWPNVDAGSDDTSKAIRLFREVHQQAPIRFVKNLPPEDFIRLLSRTSCIVGNSSVGIREASFMGIPAVNIGSRQAGRERSSNVRDVSETAPAIVEAAIEQIRAGRYEASRLYGSGESGPIIADILARSELSVEKHYWEPSVPSMEPCFE